MSPQRSLCCTECGNTREFESHRQRQEARGTKAPRTCAR
jgi:hypothetical protein